MQAYGYYSPLGVHFQFKPYIFMQKLSIQSCFRRPKVLENEIFSVFLPAHRKKWACELIVLSWACVYL
jgi:hypothetical protein